MSDYSRRISYIYEYGSGEKGQNKGFIKTEIRKDEGKMDIELRELPLDALTEATVGYYMWKDGRIKACGYRKEKITDKNHHIFMEFNPKDMKGVEITEIGGVIIRCRDVFYTAEWSLEEFDVKAVDWVDSLKEILEESRGEDEKEIPDRTGKDAKREVKRETKKERMKEEELQAQEITEAQEETSEVPEIPDFLRVKKKDKGKNIKYDKSYHIKINNWKGMFKKYDIVEPFNDDVIHSCIEIGYEDLKYLPSSCKNVLNNSFLLHGLYYYKHVLIGKQRCRRMQKIYVLGVPGRYENSERMIASMFGFDNFKAAQRTGINSSNFGYWYTMFRDDE